MKSDKNSFLTRLWKRYSGAQNTNWHRQKAMVCMRQKKIWTELTCWCRYQTFWQTKSFARHKFCFRITVSVRTATRLWTRTHWFGWSSSTRTRGWHLLRSFIRKDHIRSQVYFFHSRKWTLKSFTRSRLTGKQKQCQTLTTIWRTILVCLTRLQTAQMRQSLRTGGSIWTRRSTITCVYCSQVR